ncbi:hypothetical protein BASA83_010068 [Batrachochytrium salamandrivorans]|nr:hypothetical protein BASA83_010068 [Batrachochytrium salamandrivorans]
MSTSPASVSNDQLVQLLQRVAHLESENSGSIMLSTSQATSELTAPNTPLLEQDGPPQTNLMAIEKDFRTFIIKSNFIPA